MGLEQASFELPGFASGSDSSNLAQAVSPSMVQLEETTLKFCERAIAMPPKCANLGTVQQSFPASQGIGFIPGPEFKTRGDKRQSGNRQAESGRKAKAFRQ
jgi:hypothetical protein